MAFKFCPQCAQPLQERELDTNCTYVHWDNPVPVVAAVVEHECEIILARNKAWPVPFHALISRKAPTSSATTRSRARTRSSSRTTCPPRA